MKGISTNPLTPEDIAYNVVTNIVPTSLKDFLSRICNNNDDKGKTTKVLSIAQDKISIQLNGKKRMPKQVGLGMSLKSSIRSK